MEDKKTNRRSFLAASGIITAGALLPSCDSSSLSDKSPKDLPDLFNLNKYEDNLEAFVKIMGDTSGKTSYLTAQGRIYSNIDRKQAIPLCGVKGMRLVKFEKIDGGYKHFTRDWAFYCDLKTGQPLDEYTNPFTGELVKTKQILTPLFKWDWTSNGQVMKDFSGNAWLMGKPLRFPFIREGNDITTTMELLVQYGSGAAGDEFMNFLVDANDLNNPNLTSAPMRHVWTGNSGWMRWLNMGDIKGRSLWQSSGRKYASIEAVPAIFKDLAEHYFPESIANPETYEKVSLTTMPDTENVTKMK